MQLTRAEGVRVVPVAATDRAIYPDMADHEFAKMLAASSAQCWQGRFYRAFVIRMGAEAVGRMSLIGGEDGSVSEGVEVFDAHRRRGVATAAMKQLIDWAASLGFMRLTGQIRTDNAASIALHRRLGFTIDCTHFNRRGREVHEVSLPLRRSNMQHEMNLRNGPFQAIASGRKRYELRLNDEKRRAIRVGDRITFTNLADGTRCTVRVTSLHPFADFAALYESLPLLECGYTAENVAGADPRDMEAYYPPEKQALYGVLGIGIELTE